MIQTHGLRKCAWHNINKHKQTLRTCICMYTHRMMRIKVQLAQRCARRPGAGASQAAPLIVAIDCCTMHARGRQRGDLHWAQLPAGR